MTTPRTILIVDDSPEDVEATRRALTACGLGSSVHHCSDGDAALDFLFRRGAFEDSAEAPRPGMILLDLNMPGTDGREVLQLIKGDKDLKKIPVIILTTSVDDRDIESCYESGANSFVQKPLGLDGLIKAIERLKQFWFEVAIFPKCDA